MVSWLPLVIKYVLMGGLRFVVVFVGDKLAGVLVAFVGLLFLSTSGGALWTSRRVGMFCQKPVWFACMHENDWFHRNIAI